jgi:nicotinamidase-related amidase
VPLVDRGNRALVVVDVQAGLTAQESMTQDERGEAEASLERAVWLAGIATLIDIPAVVAEEGPERAGQTEPRLLERLPSGTSVHVKQTFGLAGQPEVVEAINATKRCTLVLASFETDTCVAQSAIELHDLGFRVVVAEDAMYSTGALEHTRGLRRMQHAGVEINDCKSVAFEWLRLVDDAVGVVRHSTAKYGPAPLRL